MTDIENDIKALIEAYRSAFGLQSSAQALYELALGCLAAMQHKGGEITFREPELSFAFSGLTLACAIVTAVYNREKTEGADGRITQTPPTVN